MKVEFQTIQLRNPGPLKPAPQLEGFAQDVSTELQSWPGMISATHWQLGDPTRVDGAEFHVEKGGELGHIHLNGEVHLALTKALRDCLVAGKLAKPFRWSDAWVTAPITSPHEADQALWLFRLGYDRLGSTSEETLFDRIASHATHSS